MYAAPVTYDPTELARLGAERIGLMARLDQVQKELAPQIIGAIAADVPQVEVCELTGYNRESIRLIVMTPAQRQAERDKRKARKA